MSGVRAITAGSGLRSRSDAMSDAGDPIRGWCPLVADPDARDRRVIRRLVAVIMRQPLAHARRQQQRLLAITRQEALRHLAIVLKTTRAMAASRQTTAKSSSSTSTASSATASAHSPRRPRVVHMARQHRRSRPPRRRKRPARVASPAASKPRLSETATMRRGGPLLSWHARRSSRETAFVRGRSAVRPAFRLAVSPGGLPSAQRF
jgi:hypothetical protein